MTFRALKIFVAVAEEKNMHAAAKKLFISQPAISQTITELEKEYGVQLFDRLSQRLYLTETGKELLSYAYHLLSIYDDMEQLLHSHGMTKRLRIGASVSVGTCLLGTYMEKMQREYPNANLQITIDNTSRIEEMLLTSQLDIGLVEGMIVDKSLCCLNIAEDELILVAAPDHPLACGREIEIEELQNQPFISRESGSNDRNQFEQFLRDHHILMRKQWTCSNTEAIKNAVKLGHGIAILSRMLVLEELKNCELVQIIPRGVRISRSIKFVYHKDKFLSDELKGFARICGADLQSAD